MFFFFSCFLQREGSTSFPTPRFLFQVTPWSRKGAMFISCHVGINRFQRLSHFRPPSLGQPLSGCKSTLTFSPALIIPMVGYRPPAGRATSLRPTSFPFLVKNTCSNTRGRQRVQKTNWSLVLTSPRFWDLTMTFFPSTSSTSSSSSSLLAYKSFWTSLGLEKTSKSHSSVSSESGKKNTHTQQVKDWSVSSTVKAGVRDPSPSVQKSRGNMIPQPMTSPSKQRGPNGSPTPLPWNNFPSSATKELIRAQWHMRGRSYHVNHSDHVCHHLQMVFGWTKNPNVYSLFSWIITPVQTKSSS